MTELRTTARIEAQLRIKAKGQGIRLAVSRQPESIDNMGGYMLIDAAMNCLIDGSGFDLSADEVAAYLA